MMLIVFMNMLIAIMGETFGNVLAVEKENALMEQAQMINDYVDLLDLGQIFKGKKHIILLTPDISISAGGEDLGKEINELQTALTKKMDRDHDVMTKRQDALDK